MSILHRNRILIPLAATSLLFLAACGNKGPLVLPQKPVEVQQQAAPAAPAEQAPPAHQDTAAGSPTSTPDPVTPAPVSTTPVSTAPASPAPVKKVDGGNE